MKKCTLFIGNGLNRISQNGASWGDVIQGLADFAGKIVNKKDTRPFPLLYEDLFLHYAKKSGNEDDFKKKVAELMKNMRPNEFHKRIASAGFNHIITTNYDYCIEDAVDKRPGSAGSDETRYSLFRRHRLGNTSIWHVHGEIIKPKTINLGYEHYSGALSKMRNYTFWDRKRSPKSKKHSQFRQGEINFDSQGDIQCAWTDVFLRDDIHIVGLGLDYCEIDLWWLLVVKERLKWGAFDSSAKKHKVGATYYYYTDTDADTNTKEDRISMLESLGVQREYSALVSDDWKKFHEKALDKIMKRKQA